MYVVNYLVGRMATVRMAFDILVLISELFKSFIAFRFW